MPAEPGTARHLINDHPHEAQIRRLVDEVPVAPQQQRLLDGRLRPEMGLLGHAVLVRLPRLDPRRAQPVVVQHLPEPIRMPVAQRLEQRQHLQSPVGIGHQLRYDLRLPHVGERVLPRPPRPRRLRRRGQRPALPLARRPLAHPRRRCGRRQRLVCHPLLAQSPNPAHP